MATDYAKKKNEELIALCKERGLPHSGKKADFVKRLEEYDAARGAPTTKAAIEDEIDWDDEPATETAKAATTEPAAGAIEAGGVGEVKNPVDVPNQTLAEDPAKADDLTLAATGDPAPNGEVKPAQEEKEPENDYSQGIAERTLDEEIEKRKARARKFGLPETNDEIKALERAKRFGVTEGSHILGLLNQGLSQGKDKKRGREGVATDGSIRKKGRRSRPVIGKRQASDGPQETKTAQNGPLGSWMSKEDREKAEKRKQRFAATG